MLDDETLMTICHSVMNVTEKRDNVLVQDSPFRDPICLGLGPGWRITVAVSCNVPLL